MQQGKYLGRFPIEICSKHIQSGVIKVNNINSRKSYKIRSKLSIRHQNDANDVVLVHRYC